MIDFTTFLLMILPSIISFIFYVLASHYIEWRKNKKESKRINELFKDFLKSFTLLENPYQARVKALVLIQRIGEKLIREKLDMIYSHYYIPKGLGSSSSESDSIIKEPKNKIIRIENEKWYVEFHYYELIISESSNVFGENGWNEAEQFRIFKQTITSNSDENTLISFLRFLEEKYQNKGIKKKSDIYVNDELISEIRKFMNIIKGEIK